MKLYAKKQIAFMAAGVLLGVEALSTIGCARTMTGTAAPPAPEVEIAIVEQKDIPIEREWIGTLDGMVNAAIKAEVTGYLVIVLSVASLDRLIRAVESWDSGQE